MPKSKITIEKEQWYTLSDIVRHGFFPWATSFSAVRNIVTRDKDNKNILKCTVNGSGRGTKYLFKGANIIKFIEAVADGK